jgi:hypothetical protein
MLPHRGKQGSKAFLLVQPREAKARLRFSAIFRHGRDSRSIKETALEAENADLRGLLTQAGIGAARLLAKAGIVPPKTRLPIRTVASDKKLKLTWIERGGPVVQEPSRRSFGSRLINRLAEQLHGDVWMKYEPAGLVYELDVPLSALREHASVDNKLAFALVCREPLHIYIKY